MVKKNFKTFWIDIPTFKSGVRVLICSDLDRSKKLIEKWFDEEYHGFEEYEGCDLTTGYGKTITKNGYSPLLWMPYFNNELFVGVLAHEAVHCSLYITKTRGIDNEETHAYLVEQIVESCLKRCL